MRFEILLQFLVPLSIMAMWALTSLLNREAQPLPARSDKGPAPGPGAGRLNPPTARTEPFSSPRATMPTQRPPLGLPDRATTNRRPDPLSSARPGSARDVLTDDGIVILESEPRGPRSGPANPASSPSLGTARTSRGNSGRRGSRPRPSGASGQPRSNQAGPPRALTSLVNQALAQNKARPLEIVPLSSPLGTASNPLTQISGNTTTEQLGGYQLHTALSSTELRAMLSSSTKLREIALLNELLQPPLALRPPCRRR